MLETQSQEEFEHLHSDGVKNLKIEEGELAQARSRFNLRNLDDDLQNTLRGARESLEEKSKSDAEEVFQQALKSLNEVETKRFVIANVLESLKDGQLIKDILPRYAGMGLAPQAPPSSPSIDATNPLPMTQALLERKSLWERVTTTMAQIAVNAVKTVPKWVEIEPHFGFVGPVPTLGFTLKGKGMSVYELFEALRNAHTAPPAPPQQ
jgi:hypothetical protein